MKSTLCLIVLVVLQGCSTFTSPKEKPVIEDHMVNPLWGDRQIGILATTAERRVVIVKTPGKSDTVATMQLCAEPSPDVAESLASSLRVLAEASGEYGNKFDATASLDLAKSLTTTVSKLFTRSQGVQLFRDGLYSLCQANVNQAMTNEQLVTFYDRLLERAYALTLKELPTIASSRSEDAADRATAAEAAAKAAQQKAEDAAADAKKTLEEIKKQKDTGH